MEITEEELQKRLAVLDSKGRIAGPDDQIYSGGLTMTSVPRSTPSTKTSPSGTGGVGRSKKASSVQPDPMQPAVDALAADLLASIKEASQKRRPRS